MRWPVKPLYTPQDLDEIGFDYLRDAAARLRAGETAALARANDLDRTIAALRAGEIDAFAAAEAVLAGGGLPAP